MDTMQRPMLVTNRSSSRVYYAIPDLHITRDIAPGETIRVPYEELVHLSWKNGGRELMEQYLFITGEGAEEAMDEMSISREDESYMTREDIINLLANGSEDELLDCLDFAPQGVLDILKDEAVKMKLNDIRKREIIKEKLNFDITTAIHLSEPDAEEETATAAAPSRRRTSGSKYKVVSKG